MEWRQQAETLLSDVWEKVSTSNSTCSFIVSVVSASDSSCSFSQMFEEMLLKMPLELVPDAVAWATVQLLAVYLIRQVVVRRPKACACAALAWIGWFAWRVAVVEGYEAIEAAQERGAVALLATGEFTRVLVKLVRDWIHFFMPFMNDLCSWLAQGWKHANLRQRLAIGCALLSMLAIYNIAALFWEYQHLVLTLLFHASFFVFGPMLWYLTAFLPTEMLPLVVHHMVTTLPSVVSFVVLACEYWRQAEEARAQKALQTEQPKKTWRSFFSRRTAETPSSPTSSPKRPSQQSKKTWRGFFAHRETPSPASSPRRRELRRQGSIAGIPMTNLQLQRLWLSYWTCWPALRLLEIVLNRVPQLIPSAGANALQLQVELQRAMLIFVVWLMLWKGSRFLNLILGSFLSQGIWENVAWFFGAQSLQGLIRTKGLLAAVASSLPLRGSKLMGLTSLISAIMNRLWLMGFTFFILVLLLCCVVWTFYSALSVVSQGVTAALWVFAALDTTDTVTTRAEAFYSRKLAFWVLAMAWDVVASLPFAGVFLRIFTPVAFSVWLVAGDFVLRQLMVPLLRWAAILSTMVASKVVQKVSGRRAAGGAASTADAEDSSDEDYAIEDSDEHADADASDAAGQHEPQPEEHADADVDDAAGQDEPHPIAEASDSKICADKSPLAQEARLEESIEEVEKASPKRSLGTKSTSKGDLAKFAEEPREERPRASTASSGRKSSSSEAPKDLVEEAEEAEGQAAPSSGRKDSGTEAPLERSKAQESNQPRAPAPFGRKSKPGTKKRR